MRIAFIGQKSLVLGDGGGGVEKHVAALATRFVQLGHQVTVYARRRYTDAHPRYVQGVRVFYPWTWHRKNTEAIIHVFFATLDALFRRVDVIHYHGVGPALLCWLPRLLRPRTTIIVTFHSLDRLHNKWGMLARIMLRTGEWIACKIPHGTITVSHRMQVYCRDTYGAETVFIPNGAIRNVVRKQDKLRQFDLKRGEYILSVGRIVPVKGLHYLIQAFRRVKTEKKLALVGAAGFPESYRQKLLKLAAGDRRIQFLGFQSGEHLEQLFTHAYLFCNSSESEGLPLAVLDAMGHGTTVLASDIPGNLEAMRHTGFTFENKDIEDLAEQLQHLIDHPEEVKREAARMRDIIERYFNWDRIAEQTVEVYRSLRH